MKSMTEGLCYLNGAVLPLGEARISPLDRGFLFGDGVYELVPVYGGRMFRLEDHLERLDRSLARLRIANPLSRQEWTRIGRELVERAGGGDQWWYLQVTRGEAPRDHVMPKDIRPTVFSYCMPPAWPSAEQRHQGVACLTARDFRWQRGDIKSISLLGNVLARQVSADQGAQETILFRDGFLTEASASNVWIVKEGALLGPPRSELLLEGVRMNLLHELCEELGIGFNLRPISEAEVFAADEILLSSATKEVLPVTRLDHEPVGHGALHGKPGPVYARLHEAYQRAKTLQSV